MNFKLQLYGKKGLIFPFLYHNTTVSIKFTFTVCCVNVNCNVIIIDRIVSVVSVFSNVK